MSAGETGGGRDASDRGMDVFDAIRARRSVRRFDQKRAVDEALVLEVLDAARCAPSSCNLQTWEFVWVRDAALKQQLAEETKSVLIAPVTLFVAYDRELAREGLANVQSASAAIMTLLLAATARGLASLWVNALGDRERVRELLALPDDFEVLALVCLGWPLDPEPPSMPERRPIGDVVHRERYQGRGGLPKSPDPGDWTLDDLATYFQRKLQSGTRYNKPVASFVDPVFGAVKELIGAPRPGLRLLDALPGTALFTEMLHRAYPEASLAVAEFSAHCHFFAARRAGGRVGLVPFPNDRESAILAQCAAPGVAVPLRRESGGLIVMPRVLPYPEIERGPYDVATVLFRLEGIPPPLRGALLADLASRLAPGGRIVVAWISRRSWHLPAYAVRRRMGRDSVEYAPAPEPNVIGPFEALSPGEVGRLVAAAGLAIEREIRLLPLPDPVALAAVERRVRGPARLLLSTARTLSRVLSPLEGILRPFARVRVTCLKRRA